MTAAEAEAYYKKYLGQAFHMGREEPGAYRAFQALQLPDAQLARWDNDLLDRELAAIRSEPVRNWIHHGNVITILLRGRCGREAPAARLLDEMDRMGSLPLCDRTRVLENMAGRTASQKDGGCYFICTKTKQAARLRKILEERFFPDADADEFPRGREAAAHCREALRRFGCR